MYNNFFKRAVDIIVSLFLLVILLPLYSIIIITIILERKGKVFFCQDRIGKNGKIFKMYKFRTIYWDKNNCPIITKLGSFLRKSSIDEIPQLLNILKGEMTFIGPRPWIAEYLLYFTPNQKIRCNVKPGITGWAQVNGRNGLNILEKIQYDMWYVDNISLYLDIKIIFMTLLTILKKDISELSPNLIVNEKEMLKFNYNNYKRIKASENKILKRKKINLNMQFN